MLKDARNRSNTNSFLTNIYEILNNQAYSSVIAWVNEGTAFKILDLPDFMDNVLPKYYKHKNFSSFIRQLNMYNFHKVPGDGHIFSHPLFKSDNPEQLSMICRKNSSVKGEKSSNEEFAYKITKLQESNSVLEATVERLDSMYKELHYFSQILATHLVKCQGREQYLQEALRLSMIYLKIIQDSKE